MYCYNIEDTAACTSSIPKSKLALPLCLFLKSELSKLESYNNLHVLTLNTLCPGPTVPITNCYKSKTNKRIIMQSTAGNRETLPSFYVGINEIM